jgi:hypothetical protein
MLIFWGEERIVKLHNTIIIIIIIIIIILLILAATIVVYKRHTGSMIDG